MGMRAFPNTPFLHWFWQWSWDNILFPTHLPTVKLDHKHWLGNVCFSFSWLLVDKGCRTIKQESMPVRKLFIYQVSAPQGLRYHTASGLVVSQPQCSMLLWSIWFFEWVWTHDMIFLSSILSEYQLIFHIVCWIFCICPLSTMVYTGCYIGCWEFMHFSTPASSINSHTGHGF